MFADSLITCFDLKKLGRDTEDDNSECTFWSRMDSQFSVQYLRRETDAFYQPHTHSEYNLVVCLDGRITKTQLGETNVIEPGGAMMGNFGVEHASGYLTDGGTCEAVCLTVTRKAIAGLLAEFGHPLPNGSVNAVFAGTLHIPVLRSCALDIAREMRQRELGHKMVIEGLGIQMLVETLRAWPRRNVGNCEVDLTPRLPRKDFIRAYEFMRWCRKDAFRVQNLCNFLGTSEERFARLFQAATNTSPATFYNRMLMDRGRDLLRDRGLSIKEIGFELGFKTTSHFIVAFHQQFGAPPQDYRLRLLA